jgi:hypothetical protein
MPMEVKQCNDYPLLLLALLAVFPVEGYLKVVLCAIAGILAVFNRKDSSNQSIDFICSLT